MTLNLTLLINFTWKSMGTVRFKNSHVDAVLGYMDLEWGDILITRVYYVEGLGHNLFPVRNSMMLIKRFDNNVSFEEELVHQRLQKTLTHVLELSSCIYLDDRARDRINLRRTFVTGFPTQSNSSSNAIALDSPNLLVLNTGTSQSRQHGKE
nr:integrase, catalytic region, zinc finger, CCHC-type, peptidase aspartic, catalytic [Tanacetum cinerariifolium]